MIDYTYPISREDITERAHLEELMSSFAAREDADIGELITALGESLFRNAVQLNLDEDVPVLCEFSSRVGSELLSDEKRASVFHDQVWLVRPRDEIALRFKEEGQNAPHSAILPPEQRNIATVLHFLITLNWDPRYKGAAERVQQYIEGNGLWSFKETERLRAPKQVNARGKGTI